jgi:hypothetical protein
LEQVVHQHIQDYLLHLAAQQLGIPYVVDQTFAAGRTYPTMIVGGGGTTIFMRDCGRWTSFEWYGCNYWSDLSHLVLHIRQIHNN